MTGILATSLVFLAALGLYVASMVARQGFSATGFFDGDRMVPGWALMFGLTGIIVAGLGFSDQLEILGRFGLQASHVGIGAVVAALVALIVYKRLWLAARIAGFATAGMALGEYYQSTTLRLVMIGLALIFGLPYSAHLLSGSAALLAAASDGSIPRPAAVWAIAFIVFLPAVIGGWRALALLIALETAIFVVLLFAVTGFSEIVLVKPGFTSAGIPVPAGILAERLPGVIQYSAGIGKDQPVGGIFTTMGVLSNALALAGLFLSPVSLHLALTSRAGKGLARGLVWLVAGLAAGIVLVVLPFLAARIVGNPVAFAGELAKIELFIGAGLVFALVLAGQIAIFAFTGGGAILVCRELVTSYLLPGKSPKADRLAARITIALFFITLATCAAFAPLASAIVGGLAIPMALQMLPAFLGLAFVPWISRSAVLTGLIVGGLFVFFTEAAGLVFVEGLFGVLPWGRWPLTIHSALWGLAMNATAVLLVSIFTRRKERTHRDRLHDEFASQWRTDFGGRYARGAKWSLTLIWAFLALGPGAILGNTFFSQPIFTEGDTMLGISSLWAWQILFWLIGVPLVWWLAERSRLGHTGEAPVRTVTMPETGGRRPAEAPAWIAASIARVTER